MKFLYWFLGVLLIVLGLLVMIIEYFVVGLLAIAFGAFLCFRGSKCKKNEKSAVSSVPAFQGAKIVDNAHVFPVAGVTFDNRQATLKKIYNDDAYGETELEPYKYKGEDAIRVLHEGKDIGNIRRCDIKAVKELIKEKYVVSLDVDNFENEDDILIYRADVIISKV